MVGVSRLLTFKRIALSLAMLLAAVAVAGKLAAAASSEGPSASFTYDPASPLSGQEISFSSTSSDDGVLTDLDWDFGDGSSASGAGANHAYTLPGPYTVKLTVTDDEGLSSTAEQTVTVLNREPNADFHWTPESPVTGETVDFTSDADDPEGRMAAERWDLDGDGDFSDHTGSSASRAFTAAGSYTVSLLVEDQDGSTATSTKTVEVIDPPNQAPSADFDFSPASPTILDTITFTSTSADPDGTIVSWEWDLDNDGLYDDASGSETSEMFALANTYTIGLLVTDNEGGTATATRTVTVGAPLNDPPSAAFRFSPSAPIAGEKVTFTSDATDDGTILLEEWDLDGDGIYDKAGSQVDHTYATSGSYNVRLRVTDELGAQDTTIKIVEVGEPPNDPPTASFDFTPSSPKANEPMTFTSTSADDGSIVSTEWDFTDDGIFDVAGAQVQHSYQVPDTYTVRMRVTDDKGVSREITDTVTVPNQQPTADFSFSPTAPRKGQTVSFSSLATDPENRVHSLMWDLDGDNEYDDAAGLTAEKAFDSPGNHTVRLRIDDLDGGSDTVSKTVIVESVKPEASFTISPEQPLSLVRVTFTSTSTDADGTITDIRWDTDDDGKFDDGSDVEATRIFSSPGAKEVHLRITDDDGNVVTATRTLTVDNRPPTARIEAPTAATKNTTVTFKSTSSDLDGSIAEIGWDTDNDGAFDDGTSTQVSRSFSSTGPKTVRLRVTDDRGFTDEDTHVVDIGGNNSPTAAFGFTPSIPKTAEQITFTSTSSDSDGTIAETEWDLDNDGEFEALGKTAKTSFPAAGARVVTLRVTDDDGAAVVAQRTVDVVNRPPTAFITASNTSPFSLEAVTFSVSATDPDGTIESWQWDFDADGRYDDRIGMSVPWTFPKSGTYPVEVMVTDNSGAHGFGTIDVTVSNTLPRPTFTLQPTSPNPHDTVVLLSTSVDPDGEITKTEWDTDDDGSFDDGTGTQVTKTFPSSGTHFVRLRVTDDDGAAQVGEQKIVVGNRAPVASFDWRPGLPVTDQQVTFFSTSDDPDNNIDRQEWDLDGDGSYETAGASAVRSFPAGSFNVSLRVTDTGGSVSIVTQTIVVSQPAPQSPQAPQISSQGPQLRLLSPFPIVRIAGRIGRKGTRFRVLSVDAPRGASVTVRCTGRRCPFKTRTRAASAGKRLAYAARKVRIRKIEGRLLRAGTMVRIYVTKTGAIGKYTSIRVRRGKPPRRADRCLLPTNKRKPVICPS